MEKIQAASSPLSLVFEASEPGRGENGGGNDCFLLKLFLYFFRIGDDILDI